MIEEIIGGEYLILKTLEKGGTSIVYLVKSLVTGGEYAAKVYESQYEYFKREIEILKKLSLYNISGITHLISYGESPIVRGGVPDEDSQPYIIIEYIPNKDLLYHVQELNGLDEIRAKRIFYKILKIVEECHNNGIFHRDLKLENILLDEKFNPILCDFGYAGIIERENVSRKSTEFLGTNYYIPPEILSKIPYDGFKCDIFSLGVILFCLVFCSFGFSSANGFNKFYKLIINKEYGKYWTEIGKKIGFEMVNNASPEFKNLYLQMVAYKPDERPNISEILNHEWMKGI